MDDRILYALAVIGVGTIGYLGFKAYTNVKQRRAYQHESDGSTIDVEGHAVYTN